MRKVLTLEAATNIRDIGGYEAADGRRVAFGRVLRGASPAAITPADAETLRRAGLKTVCDLRGGGEVARNPAPRDLLPGVAFHATPIAPQVGASLRDLLRTEQATGEDTVTVLRMAYVAYARDWSEVYAALFRRVADPASHVLLFHCSAGKDRTGFGAALLLSALGVSRDDVMADYLATNDLWRPEPDLIERLPPSIAPLLLGAHATYLDAAFDAIHADHGTVEAYLDARLGIDAAGLARLRNALLD